jgi:signal transduction histidine kinase
MTTRFAHSCTRILGLFAMLGAYAPEARAGHGTLVARPILRGDARRLKQIVVNLLSDAVKFFKPGNKVKVSLENSGHVFQATDTGIGIAPKDILKALSQFGQVDNNLSRQSDGTGLGLLLASSHVESHGGSLDLQSQPGVGTTVTVRFPAARIVKSAHDKRRFEMDDRAAS